MIQDLTEKKYLHWLLLTGLLFISLDGLSRAGLFFLGGLKHVSFDPLNTQALRQEHRKIITDFTNEAPPYLQVDPVLGWTVRPGSQKNLHQINLQGIRSGREYSPLPAEGMIRIAAFGDSYTHGSQVANDQTWTAALEKMAPSLEVLNFGVPAYGTDQAYLRFQMEGPKYRPTIFIMGYMTENINRQVNVFRPFYDPATRVPFTKPRFKEISGALSLVPNPLKTTEDYRTLLTSEQTMLPRLGQDDFYYQTRYKSGPFDRLAIARLTKLLAYENKSAHQITRHGQYNKNSEAFRITVLILESFYREARNLGAEPVIVIFPCESDLRHFLQTGRKSHQPLLDSLSSKNLRALDISDALAELAAANGGTASFYSEQHLSVRGNKSAAEAIYRRLTDEKLV